MDLNFVIILTVSFKNGQPSRYVMIVSNMSSGSTIGHVVNKNLAAGMATM